MDRRSFIGSVAALVATGASFGSAAASMVGKQTTQLDLLAALPRPGDGDWLKFALGSGVVYGKQFGFGTEHAPHGEPLLYIETQIGQASGACNPNTTRKTYLKTAHFGTLLTEYSVLASVAQSGNMVTRWADIGDNMAQSPQDARLRLVDAPYIYDERPLTIETVETQSIQVAGKDRDTTRIVASYPHDSAARLQTVELWHTPAVPFGVAKYKATVRGLDPFDLSLVTFGSGYKPTLGLSLAAIRAMTIGGSVGVLQQQS